MYNVMIIKDHKATTYKRTKVLAKAINTTRELIEQGHRAYYIKRGKDNV